MNRRALYLVLLCVACGTPAAPVTPPVPSPPPSIKRTLTVIGTNDLHGHIGNLPLFGGYVAVLRELRAKDGAVVLLDGGDMFQGTLESNPNEGAAVVEAYNVLGYNAVAIGNHEFDFGPAGPDATPGKPEDDARGALKARARDAKFPFLAANTVDAATGEPVGWDNVRGTTLLSIADLKVGIIGITTESTPMTTISQNVIGLRFTPLAETLEREARALRAEGADVVLVAAHAGAKCKDFANPDDTSSCQDDEIFAAADALPTGLIDVIVGGHTHAGVAHRRNGIAIIESFAKGVAFGRVDVRVEKSQHEVKVAATMFPPQDIATESPTYEGKKVEPDGRVAELVAAREKAAKDTREQPLGVTVAEDIRAVYDLESPLGNLVADWMRRARPGADIAMTNGGGLRANLQKGPLTYGGLFALMPFDNRFADVKLRGSDLRNLLVSNLKGGRGILSLSGISAVARCENGELMVDIFRDTGKKKKSKKKVADEDNLTIATSDFLAWGGDGVIGRLGLPESAIVIDTGLPIRDHLAALLKKEGGTIGVPPAEPREARFKYPGKRPVQCP